MKRKIGMVAAVGCLIGLVCIGARQIQKNENVTAETSANASANTNADTNSEDAAHVGTNGDQKYKCLFCEISSLLQNFTSFSL